MSVDGRIKTGVPMQRFSIFSRIRGYWRWIQMLPSLHKFTADETAQERLKIIQFYDEHGEAQTIKYFGANRKTVWTWKQQLRRAGGQLQALRPHSTRPKHTRRMTTDPRLVAFIREIREAHPHLGQEKIQPLLDAHSQKLGIASLAVSTIGKVIRRNHLFPKPGKVYHDPNSGWAKNKPKKHRQRRRVRYAPKPAELGYLQLDTVERVLDRLKVYVYSGVDVKGKFAFSLPYSKRTSDNTVDFFQKFAQVYPVPIRAVQTDNGSEFLGEFESHLAHNQIPHHFTYPRCPKVNGCIERYQRTLSEEFLQVHEFAIRQPREFYLHLADYLVFYNCERAHQALALQTPLAYLLAQGALSKMSVTRTRR
jgi:transposase InsO family protein